MDKCMLRLVTPLCLTLCDPMDCSPPGSSVHGDSPGKKTGVCCYSLLQEISPTQESNPGLLHYRRIYCLSYQGSPYAKSITHTLNGKLLCLSSETLRDSNGITESMLKKMSRRGVISSVECIRVIK